MDAKHDVVKILVRLKKRDDLLNRLEDEIENIDCNEAKATYFILLKLSCRIFNQIERLRVDNPLLNRPFIFKNQNMQNLMIKQVLNVRQNLRARFLELSKKEVLDRILDKSGKIIKLSELSLLNRSIKRNKTKLMSV